MFPLFHSLKFAAAGALVALSAGSTPASAVEMVQNLGPVGPNQAVLATKGSLHVIAFFEANTGRCALNAVVWDNLATEPGESAKRVRVSIGPGEIVQIDSAKQESVNLQCGSDAATLAVIDTESVVASGITAQPPAQPVSAGASGF
jgi:hypothetical protein